ncbi:LysM peptidoglycan-binding domain-containing protein [Paenibacillus caui]|uniref:LysM peptidoglycan-binding domain-containing protein n=1 Tax=Paenibacillus caui TaxID=2873927 RepID=UPI001CA9E6BF|nr:LysM domain-containing protein [Paenibacillus caui]
MEQPFFPGRAFGPGPFFSPFFHPFFFPRRRFFPFFFISPFFFPFFRGEETRDGMYYKQHQCKDGDTFGSLAQMYNCPQPILEAMNPHIQDPSALMPGNIVNIPRLDKMYCHKMYLEQEASQTDAYPGSTAPMTSPYGGMPAYPMEYAQPNKSYMENYPKY